MSGIVLMLASVNVNRQSQALSDEARCELHFGQGKDASGLSKTGDDWQDEDETLMTADLRQLGRFCMILKAAGFILTAAGLVLLAAGVLL